MAAFAILVPVWFGIQVRAACPASLVLPVRKQRLTRFDQQVEQTVQNGGEVLFISQPQLLTFKDIAMCSAGQRIRKGILIEMVMAKTNPISQNFTTTSAPSFCADSRRYAMVQIPGSRRKLGGGKQPVGEGSYRTFVVRIPADPGSRRQCLPAHAAKQPTNCPYPQLSP